MNETYFPFTAEELKLLRDGLESRLFYWHNHYDGVIGSGHDSLVVKAELLLVKIENCIKVFETEEGDHEG